MTEQVQPAVMRDDNMLEIIAFRLNGEVFCVMTKTIREIRGWLPSTPVPHSPPGILGVMNLRGTVIPVIDLALRLGMLPTVPNERSAIVVTEVHGMVLGLLVDQVSDILTVKSENIQPLPKIVSSIDEAFSDGIIAHEGGMICFLNLAGMFHPTALGCLAARG